MTWEELLKCNVNDKFLLLNVYDYFFFFGRSGVDFKTRIVEINSKNSHIKEMLFTSKNFHGHQWLRDVDVSKVHLIPLTPKLKAIYGV